MHRWVGCLHACEIISANRYHALHNNFVKHITILFHIKSVKVCLILVIQALKRHNAFVNMYITLALNNEFSMQNLSLFSAHHPQVRLRLSKPDTMLQYLKHPNNLLHLKKINRKIKWKSYTMKLEKYWGNPCNKIQKDKSTYQRSGIKKCIAQILIYSDFVTTSSLRSWN